jgi:hypothetical protein
MIGSLRVSYRRDLTGFSEGLQRWLKDDGSEEAEAAGCEVAQLLQWARQRLKGKDGV